MAIDRLFFRQLLTMISIAEIYESNDLPVYIVGSNLMFSIEHQTADTCRPTAGQCSIGLHPNCDAARRGLPVRCMRCIGYLTQSDARHLHQQPRFHFVSGRL